MTNRGKTRNNPDGWEQKDIIYKKTTWLSALFADLLTAGRIDVKHIEVIESDIWSLVSQAHEAGKREMAEKMESERLKAFRWGVNYLATLINESTLISELYGWKGVVDWCVEKAHELAKKQIDTFLKKGDTE